MTVDHPSRIAIFRDGDQAQVRLVGPLNADSARLLDERLRGVIAEGCGAVALDLGASDYLDSDGVRWLQRLLGDLTDRDIELRLAVREGSRVDRTMRLVQLDRTFAIERYPVDAEDAEPVPMGQGS